MIALGVGLAIIARTFPQLSNLDVTALPETHLASKKKEILTKRARARSQEWQKILARRLVPLRQAWGQVQLRFRIYVGRMERLWYHEQATAPKPHADLGETAEARYERLLTEGHNLLAASHYEQAENAFIAAMRIHQQEPAAYRGLADTYAARGSLAEAKETYRYALHLAPDDDALMVKLAEIAENEGHTEEAISYYQQAVVANDALSSRFYHLAELLLKIKQPAIAKEAVVSAVQLEPKNAKYLDLLIETAILAADKQTASQFYNELRLANPENQRLEGFKDRIAKM